jgi:DNA mismatch endonuclease (patch repair protein)
MARVKGQDTKPEKVVRSLLHKMGYRFRLHRKDLPGKPDVVLPKHRKVIFIHGCFWHGHKGCPRAARPTSNVEFWDRKIDGNIKRDVKARRLLKILGWKSLVVWQCKTKDVEVLGMHLSNFLSS